MLNETNQSNGWGIFIVIIVIIIIIWVIVANNRTPDTHIHAKPIFNKKTNTLKIRLSKYGVNYKVVEEKFPGDDYNVSKGPSVFVTHASFPNNKSSVTTTVNLPFGTNILNTTVRVTNFLDQEDVVQVAHSENFTTCVKNCLQGVGETLGSCTVQCGE